MRFVCTSVLTRLRVLALHQRYLAVPARRGSTIHDVAVDFVGAPRLPVNSNLCIHISEFMSTVNRCATSSALAASVVRLIDARCDAAEAAQPEPAEHTEHFDTSAVSPASHVQFLELFADALLLLGARRLSLPTLLAAVELVQEVWSTHLVAHPAASLPPSVLSLLGTLHVSILDYIQQVRRLGVSSACSADVPEELFVVLDALSSYVKVTFGFPSYAPPLGTVNVLSGLLTELLVCGLSHVANVGLATASPSSPDVVAHVSAVCDLLQAPRFADCATSSNRAALVDALVHAFCAAVDTLLDDRSVASVPACPLRCAHLFYITNSLYKVASSSSVASLALSTALCRSALAVSNAITQSCIFSSKKECDEGWPSVFAVLTQCAALYEALCVVGGIWGTSLEHVPSEHALFADIPLQVRGHMKGFYTQCLRCPGLVCHALARLSSVISLLAEHDFILVSTTIDADSLDRTILCLGCFGAMSLAFSSRPVDFVMCTTADSDMQTVPPELKRNSTFFGFSGTLVLEAAVRLSRRADRFRVHHNFSTRHQHYVPFLQQLEKLFKYIKLGSEIHGVMRLKRALVSADCELLQTIYSGDCRSSTCCKINRHFGRTIRSTVFELLVASAGLDRELNAQPKFEELVDVVHAEATVTVRKKLPVPHGSILICHVHSKGLKDAHLVKLCPGAEHVYWLHASSEPIPVYSGIAMVVTFLIYHSFVLRNFPVPYPATIHVVKASSVVESW